MAIQNDTVVKTTDQPTKTFGMVTNAQYIVPKGIPRTRDKVAIVGFAPSSMQDVRVFFGDPTWEIWSINQLYIAFPAIVEHTTRWFQIHPRQEYDMAVRDIKHHQWLANQKDFPIYMQEKEPDIPMAIPFPKDEILRAFPRKYFTNSISWECALAILEGFSEIHVYGIDMSQDDEYCCDPHIKVLTADLQWIEAEKLSIGQKLLSFDENIIENKNRKWRSGSIEKMTKLIRPCFRLSLSDGSSLISSAEHRWLIKDQDGTRWKETEKLTDSSNLIKLIEPWQEIVPHEAGYLAGAFDADGFVSQTIPPSMNSPMFTIGFAQQPNVMSEKVERLLTKNAFKFGIAPNGTVNNYRIQGGKNECLRFLGQVRPTRLLADFNPNLLGNIHGDSIKVERMDFIGDQEVIGLKTSTGTFVAEGFASHNSEQRPSVEYFIGWADALGIKVRIPPQSDLCKTVWLYPFEDDAPMRQKIDARRGELRGRVNEISMNEQNMRDTRMQMLGALDNMSYIQKTWSNAIRQGQPGQMIQKR